MIPWCSTLQLSGVEAAVTVIVDVVRVSPDCAVIVAVPIATACTTLASDTDAMRVSDDDQVNTDRPQGAGCDAGAVELPVPAPACETFPDVPDGHPFDDEVCWLEQMGITGGYQDGTFKPSQAVSRQAMAAFLADHPETAAAMKLIKQAPPSTGFADSTYRGLNAFRATNAQGETKAVRWAAVPVLHDEPAEKNATMHPSALIAGGNWAPSEASVPSGPRLIRTVFPVTLSCTNTSNQPFVSSGTRFVASERNATNRPSALIAGYELGPLASLPSLATLTRVVLPVLRSWTNTSHMPLSSCATRLEAYDVNATNRPSWLMAGA